MSGESLLPPEVSAHASIDMTNMVNTVRFLSFWIENRKKNDETVNNDAREDELHSTHQGLSNNSTGHDVD